MSQRPTPTPGRSRASAGGQRRASRSSRPSPVLVVVVMFLVTVLVGVLAVRVLTPGSGSQEPPVSAPSTLNRPEPIDLDMTGFDASHIIDDEVFYDSTTMSQDEISSLILTLNAGCHEGSDGTLCLAQATFDTQDIEATTFCPEGYSGGEAETAAEIISKVASSCDVNPQVLLTLLQKEQGLLTTSGERLSARDYEAATGFACPDGTECDPRYAGFLPQVYGAASQFQRYRVSPGTFEVVAGQSSEIAYSPDASCGSASLTADNQATAGLYDYTPYQPNEAAAKGGDSCTSWGNWNFYGVFRTLFGDPAPAYER